MLPTDKIKKEHSVKKQSEIFYLFIFYQNNKTDISIRKKKIIRNI